MTAKVIPISTAPRSNSATFPGRIELTAHPGAVQEIHGILGDEREHWVSPEVAEEIGHALLWASENPDIAKTMGHAWLGMAATARAMGEVKL